MIEAGITGVAALVAGAAALTNRLHARINSLDTRIDRFELYAATTYVSKEDMKETLNSLEKHIIRLEHKLDRFIGEYPKS